MLCEGEFSEVVLFGLEALGERGGQFLEGAQDF